MAESPPLLEIISEPATGAVSDPRSVAAESLRLLLEGANDNTRRAYEGDLADFFRSIGEDEPGVASVERLFRMDAARLTVTLRHYVTDCHRKRGLAWSTINRRIAAVRSLLREARRLGAAVPDPRDIVTNAKAALTYQSIEALTFEDAAQLVDAASHVEGEKGARDYAALLILCTNGLRREELVACDIIDFDRRRGRLRITGKGQGGQKVFVVLDRDAVDSLVRYLALRGNPDANQPLFASCDRSRAGKGQRLTGNGFWEVINRYGEKVLGRSLHPHAFRHTATTEALEATGGDVPRVQDFTRHKDIRTVMLYRDRLRDGQAEVTQLLGDRMRAARSRE